MKISIALCAYNGEKYLRAQLDSLRAQTLRRCYSRTRGAAVTAPSRARIPAFR